MSFLYVTLVTEGALIIFFPDKKRQGGAYRSRGAKRGEYGMEKSKGIFVCQNSILNEMHSTLNSLMHYQVRSSNCLFQLTLTFKVDQKKTVIISQMFNHVQLIVHWMHLLNTRLGVLLKTEKDFCHRKGPKRTFGHRKGLGYGILCYKCVC